MKTLFRLGALALAFLVGPPDPLQAQGGGRWTLGIHGGADLTDENTLKLLGAHVGYGITRSTRLQVGVTTVIEGPGTNVFATAGGQWSPAPWVFRPFVGGGIAMGYQEVGPFTDTEFGWLAQAGFRLAFRRVTPFAEFRLMGFTGTTSQLLVGFESRAY